ncbi:MAG: ABC transporter permease [Anaerolineae bacterium]|nr:ABC transporter permease [Anaerolineae bacterium]
MSFDEIVLNTQSTSHKRASVRQSYWRMAWWRFKKNRLAVFGAVVVLMFYFVCVLLAEFFAPYSLEHLSNYLEAPPQQIHFVDQEGNFSLRPFVYGYQEVLDMEQRRRYYEVDPSVSYDIHFLVPGESYRLLGIFETNIHLFGPDPNNPDAYAFIFGTDRLGRDMYSRILFGGRLSLLIGLTGVFLTLFFGVTLGAISGYYGGIVDNLVQRSTEFLSAFPDIPLFLALAAAIPPRWSPITVYFMLTIILSFVRWGSLARQVRGLVLSLREREYVLAAQSFGTSDRAILFRHLIPGTMSHVVVIATLSIPGMILAETALSFLGLGLRPPLTSWGVLLQEVSNVRAIRFAPWLLIPIPFILTAILGFNMLGDGLRDALDPYSNQK